MKRRDFLKNSVFLSLGGMLLPSVLFSSCRKNKIFDDLNYSGKVIIVGAGAAGLYAGYILKSKNIDFTILEASVTHGGRLGKFTGFTDYELDTGAQWLHGSNSIVGELVRYNKVEITKDDSEMSYWFGNRLEDKLPSDPFIFDADGLPDISYKEYAHQQGFGAEYDNIIEAIAGDQGASASLISAYGNHKDEENWVSGDDDFKFKGTYFDLINDFIASNILTHIQYSTQVNSIDYSGQKVILKTADGKNIEADKVIITVPVSILKSDDIQFIPSLPDNKSKAFASIGMGPGMKVFLKFSEKFYRQNLYGGTVCAAYIDDAIGKSTSSNVLLAFVMGDQASSLSALGSHETITNKLLQELDLIYDGSASRLFIASKVFDYSSSPFIKGAYSYSEIGMGNARAIAAQSVNNKLFFAGEAMNTNGHHQTVHGAVETGYIAVMEMLNNI